MLKGLQGRGEPDWAPWNRLRQREVPAAIESWLRDEGSLTARLKQAASGDFRVRVVAQGWARPYDSERRLLGMRRGGIALLREVQLICCGHPWVYARTLIPARSLQGGARRLGMLGSRPLGEVLFADPHMRRGVTQVARLQPRHRLFQRALGEEQEVEAIWGRRTLFHFSGKPLLVNEIFLPDLPLGEP